MYVVWFILIIYEEILPPLLTVDVPVKSAGLIMKSGTTQVKQSDLRLWTLKEGESVSFYFFYIQCSIYHAIYTSNFTVFPWEPGIMELWKMFV